MIREVVKTQLLQKLCFYRILWSLNYPETIVCMCLQTVIYATDVPLAGVLQVCYS